MPATVETESSSAFMPVVPFGCQLGVVILAIICVRSNKEQYTLEGFAKSKRTPTHR